MTSEEAIAHPDPTEPTEGGADESSDQAPEARAKRASLANMRHELRTPINAIIGYSEMLLEDAEARGKDAFIPDLRKILTAGARLLATINDILDATKIENANIDVTSEAFAAHVRHELRTPLNAAIGYSELLMESAEETAEDEFAADLHRIHYAGKRLLDLLDDIINLSIIEAGKSQVAPSAGSAMVRDVVSSVRSLAQGLPPTSSERGTLLVVDDNEMNRDMLSRLLQRHGYEVLVAEDGLQALSLVEGREFDLVLLDLMMPKMNGYQMLRHLKSNPALRHLPVIMISALDEIDSVVRCIELGADDYLPKPFNPVLLKARISACLEKKRLRDREQAYLEQLRIEQEKSERLLLNVLPRPIAERLKQGETPIADGFAEATVLFADLVGFTQVSELIPARDLVELLNEIFSDFDRLAERHGLEKIKTIGDAYMAVAGLPAPRQEHAAAAADMALDMLHGIARLRTSRGMPFSLRIGLNSGPVVAGVIGTKKFAYDLWGDTVNTASRMESHALPDSIGVTAAVYERLRDGYLFEERGLVAIKGKGEMQTFLLTGRRCP